MPPDYRFVKVARTDYPMIRRWLDQPHIGGWWGDADTEIALIEEDIDVGPTDMRIVWLADTPFAFVQDYPAHHWPAPHYAGYPDGTRAIDTFLGEPEFLGKGHAAAYLRQRATELMDAGATAIVIDPDPKNARAAAAYRKAGFIDRGLKDAGDGAQARVMEFQRDSRATESTT
ncbi:MAG: GNAT family N-acetyltransferase [Pseudomonadota bacterium]